MKKYYGYFGLVLIMVFSFYYTDKISNIVLNKNPLMVTIKENMNDYNIKSVNAEIIDNNIIPGINGLVVNAKESFYEMQKFDVFNDYYLVYDQQKPKITLEDNKDKYIISGNHSIRQISLVLETENTVSEYLKQNNIKASILATMDTYQKSDFFEIINSDIKGFKSLENNLNLDNINKHICIVNNDNLNLCLKQKNYLVKPNLILNNNLLEIKRNIKNGSIIVISSNTTLSDIQLLLKEIKYKDLKPVYLSEIISEENKK